MAFALAGPGIGCAETAEHAAVAAFAPKETRSAFDLFTMVKAIGNVAAVIAGLLYTMTSPMVAFAYLAGVDVHRAGDADLDGSIGVRSLCCRMLPDEGQ
jgi:hypothetical protein